MLEVKNLNHAFGENVILDDVSFKLEQGEIIGLVAPNGTGKTTLLHILMNFLRPDEGEVSIEVDDKIYNYTSEKNEVEMRKHISFLPELEHLYMDLSGRDHLEYYARLWTGAIDNVEHVINRLQISSYVDTKVRTYSLGMRQRLAFAMMLCADTPIMLMDEVMNGLDPDNVLLITNILLELKEKNKIIIIASHLLDNLDIYVDQVMFIKDSEVILRKQDKTNEWARQYLKVLVATEKMNRLKKKSRCLERLKNWVINYGPSH